MTTIELHALSFWRASQALRNPRLAPVDRAQIADTLHDIATHGPARIAQAAARRLERESVLGDGAFDFGPGAA